MGVLRTFTDGVDRIVRAANYVTTAAIWVLMSVIIVGIAARLTGFPLSGITNLSEFLLVIGVYMGVAYTQQMKQHVFLELVLNRLHGNARKAVVSLGYLVSTAICSVVVYTSWLYAAEAWRIGERMDGTPHFPIYPTKIAIAVGLTLLWLQLFSDLLGGLSSLFAGAVGRPGPGEARAQR